MSTKVLRVTNYGNGYSFKKFDSRSSSSENDSDSSSYSELGCSPPMRTQTLTSHFDSSSDSKLGCSQPLTHPTPPSQLSTKDLSSPENRQSTYDENHVFPEKSLILEQHPKNMLLSLSNYKSLQDSVISKLGSSNFNKLREVFPDLSKLRKRYHVRQPVYRLEMNAEETVYLTGHKTKRTVPFKLCEAEKYELLKVEPEYVNVFQHVFGSKTSRLMKKDFSTESTHEWKNLCRFVMSQFGLSLDSAGNVLETSKVPDYAVVMKFGANTFPFKLAENFLQKWKSESTALAELDVSFRKKLTDKQKMVETLLSGLKFEKVWSPSSHDESLFCDSDLCEYEEWLQRKHSLSLQDDPVLLYAAVSSNGEKLALVAVADYAVKLSFCDVEDDGALLELRDRFMEVTKSDDLECVSERKLNKMLERLSK